MSEALLRGDFKNKSLIKIIVLDDENLKFEGIDDPKVVESTDAVVRSDG